MQHLQKIIEAAFERRTEITPASVDAETRDAITEVISLIDSGKVRVAEKINGEWVTHQWLKKAVLLSFRIHDNEVIEGAETRFYDKVPMKFAGYDEARFRQEGFRVVPPAAVRQGAFIARNTVLMPSYVNIGAYVDEGTMVDTWATVGSCAQIGKNVHLSGGVGIGGVLEPCRPTRQLSKITALLAHVQKSLKVLSSKKVRSSLWVSILVRAPKFMTVKRVKSTTAVSLPVLSSFPVTCRLKMVNTAFTVPLSLRKWMRKLWAKSVLTNYCVPLTNDLTGNITGDRESPVIFPVLNAGYPVYRLPADGVRQPS